MEMVRNCVVVAESYVSQVLCKLVRHAASRLADVKGRARIIGDVIEDIGGATGERVGDAERMEMRCNEKGGVGDVGVSAAAVGRSWESTWETSTASKPKGIDNQ